MVDAYKTNMYIQSGNVCPGEHVPTYRGAYFVALHVQLLRLSGVHLKVLSCLTPHLMLTLQAAGA